MGSLPDFGPLQSGYDHFYGFRAGVLDYFTHKYGPPSSDTEDLWEDDVKIRQTGYLSDIVAAAGPVSQKSAGIRHLYVRDTLKI